MDSDSSVPTLPTGVKYRHQQDVDIIAWSYKSTPIDKGQMYTLVIALLFLGVSILLIIFQLFTAVINDEPFSKLILVFIVLMIICVVVVGLFTFFLNLKTWVEAIHISEEDIILHYSGRGTPKSRKFSKNNVLGLAFENPKGRDEDKVLPSLNIFYAKQYVEGTGIEEGQVDFAILMRPEEKYQLYLFLRHVLKEKGWNITYRLDNRPSW